MYLVDRDDGPHKVFFLAKDMGRVIEAILYQSRLIAPLPADDPVEEDDDDEEGDETTQEESQEESQAEGQDEEGTEAYGYETE